MASGLVNGRTFVLERPREFSIHDTLVGEPATGEVRVRIEGCGLCGSDLSVWQGQSWFAYPREPGSPGHESWGTIDAVGDGVEGFAVGDRVALLSPNGFSDYCIAKSSEAIKLPYALDGLPVPAEPLGCAMNIFRRSQIKSGEVVAIVGIGFLGALLTQLASSAGAHVIAIARRKTALQFAKDFGAMEVIQSEHSEQVKKLVMELTLGKGCDCVIEATGKQAPLNLACELTKERGRLIIAGYHQDGPRQVDMQLWNWRGLDVINAHERDADVYLDGINRAFAAIESGALNPFPLYTHTFSLSQTSQAFAALDARPEGFMKALVLT
jgi:threonine dehydrogenase-like Zn-dependent dehydrogenase